jgi:hypothetical protein
MVGENAFLHNESSKTDEAGNTSSHQMGIGNPYEIHEIMAGWEKDENKGDTQGSTFELTESSLLISKARQLLPTTHKEYR